MRPARYPRRLLTVVGAVVIIPVGSMTAGCAALGGHPAATATMTVTAPPAPGQSPATSATSGPATTAGVQATVSSGQATTPAVPAGNAVVLPFTGLDHPVDVIVGRGGGIEGAVYVTDSVNNRVVKLAGNSYTQSVLPLTGLNSPGGLALFNGENIAVTDANSSRVLWGQPPRDASTPPWEPAPASSSMWVGPFTSLQSPHGVGTINGTIYVADSGNNRVVEYSPGMNAPGVVTFTGLNNPNGVTVLNRGYADVYVVDSGNNRVLELGDGNNVPQTVLGFTGLNNPHGVAVDEYDNVYVTDSGNDRVLRLSTDRTTKVVTQTILPFTGLKDPEGVFVGPGDDVYVVDTGNNRVLKLAKTFAQQ